MGTLDRVKEIVSFLSGVAVDKIDATEKLDSGDIALDSLDRIELIMELEESFGIEISDKDVDRMPKTCLGISEYLDRRL